MPDVYDVSKYRKHKTPNGFGSLCPRHMDQAAAQALLNGSVLVDGARYSVDEEWAFKAFEHEPGRWHGFPIPWSRLPVQAARGLIAAGLLDEKVWKKAIRKGWGSEFHA